jgi:hypothetical protein
MATDTKISAKDVETLTLAEIKKQLGKEDAKKEVKVDFPWNKFNGQFISQFAIEVKKVASEAGIEGEFKVKYERSPERWDNQKGYVRDEKLILIGYRPYTDAELLENGDKLIKQAEARRIKEAKARAADLRKLNTLNRRLGLPEVTELPS